MRQLQRVRVLTAGRVRRVRPEHWIAQSWRNGGGTTHEIWRWSGDEAPGWSADGTPAGVSRRPDAWRVRLSCADITAPGPFSRFPGIARALTVLRGRLLLQGLPGAVELTAGETARFSGDVEVHGEPVGGPVRALNLMVDASLPFEVGVRYITVPETLAAPLVLALARGPDGSVAGRRCEPEEVVLALDELIVEGALWSATVDASRHAPQWLPAAPGVAAAYDRAVVGVRGEAPAGGPQWIVTAHNPGAIPRSPAENAAAMAALQADVARRGWRWQHALASDDSGGWAEPSLALSGVSGSEALALAAAYGQDAIYALWPDGRRDVVWT